MCLYYRQSISFVSWVFGLLMALICYCYTSTFNFKNNPVFIPAVHLFHGPSNSTTILPLCLHRIASGRPVMFGFKLTSRPLSAYIGDCLATSHIKQRGVETCSAMCYRHECKQVRVKKVRIPCEYRKLGTIKGVQGYAHRRNINAPL